MYLNKGKTTSLILSRYLPIRASNSLIFLLPQTDLNDAKKHLNLLCVPGVSWNSRTVCRGAPGKGNCTLSRGAPMIEQAIGQAPLGTRRCGCRAVLRMIWGWCQWVAG